MTSVEAVLAWLVGSEGRAAVQRTADRHGIAYLADDLVSDVVYRTQVAERRGDVIDNEAAWATRLLQRAAVDLLRGERRRFLPVRRSADDADEPGFAADDQVDFEADAMASAGAAALRRALSGMLAPAPWVGAACLARLTFSFDRAAAAASCPQPAGGAGPQEAADWVALWYAGRDDCFPASDAGDSAAVRQRRSRAATRMRDMLARAAAATEESVRHG